MQITTLVPSAGEPVALAAARQFLRIQYDGEDDLVASLVGSARARVEAETGLCLVTRTQKITLTCWPEDVLESGWFHLPVRPVQALASVMVDGTDVTGQMVLNGSLKPWLKPVSGGWPAAGSGIDITLTTGFGDTPDDIPQDLRLAIKLLVLQAYHSRDADRRTQTPDEDAMALLAPWRRVRL